MRPEKATIVEDLSTKLNKSPFLLITEYSGMNVLQFFELRSRLARAGAQCRVVKNTFLRRAAAEVGYPDLADSLNGQTAIVTGEGDVCAAAKILKGFSAEFQRPSVKIGVLDKLIISKEQIRELADLPPKDILQSQLLGVLKSPLQKLVILLNEPGTSLARLLNARVEKESAGAGQEGVEA
ncbi:MAG: 50S ribosomal protein L10 [Verrucomicrobia bacterium]|nr:50S ribosomal protein L10 [Verrucomicrobiota bacterium]MBV9300028.1 50S ribosomal protein L10 [Verrucomicrobiota bacterium]MBV9645306.1 50S ribosomal protein L10 [Verrucomicrobiota bacterium]